MSKRSSYKMYRKSQLNKNIARANHAVSLREKAKQKADSDSANNYCINCGRPWSENGGKSTMFGNWLCNQCLD